MLLFSPRLRQAAQPRQVPAELCTGPHCLKAPSPEPAPWRALLPKATCRARGWGNSPAPLSYGLFVLPCCGWSLHLYVLRPCCASPPDSVPEGVPKCQLPEWQPRVPAPLLSCAQLHYATPEAPGTPGLLLLTPCPKACRQSQA